MKSILPSPYIYYRVRLEGTYQFGTRNMRKTQTQSFKEEQHSSGRPFESALRDSTRELLYQSAHRDHQAKRRGTAIFQSVGRLTEDQAPSGSRSNHIYNSPHFKPNSSYNFWNDLTLNQSTRNKWELQSSTINADYNPLGNGGPKVETAIGLKSMGGSTSDLLSLRVNNKIGEAGEALSPSKRGNKSTVSDSQSNI